jgi:hypothetical protein
MPSGPASAGSTSLTGAYGSASGQLNPGYSSGPGGTGFEAVSRPQDESTESNSSLHLRCFIYVMFTGFFYLVNFFANMLGFLSEKFQCFLNSHWSC